MKQQLWRRVLGAILIIALLGTMTACGKKQPEFSLDSCAQMLLDSTPQPGFGSVGGEWLAFGLARWGGDVPQEWFDSYYEAVVAHVEACGGVLHERKYTEYSRVILALTAIGKDPANVGGYNLLVPLADYEKTVFQDVNGPAFALLALDSGNYEIPETTGGGTQATREMYVDNILSKELPGGGWALSGSTADTDITAMALQALAKYRDRQDVADAVDRALVLLSERQNEHGGFSTINPDGSESETSESVSQVIVALTELGIPMDDPRFVKNGNTLQDRLFDFMTGDYGFGHVLNDDTNLLATEQAFYALVALQRAGQGQASLYSMAESE